MAFTRFLVTVAMTLLFSAGMSFASKMDHSIAFEGKTFTSGKEVTAFCLKCHEKEGKDVTMTAHFKWKGQPNVIAGQAKDAKELGKANMINNFCINIEAKNTPGCTKCHAGYGWKDNSFDFTNPGNVDCLVCHTQDKAYFQAKGAGVAGDLAPAAIKTAQNPNGTLDLAKAATNISKPTMVNCGNCHFKGGGGDAVKHGDLDTSLFKADRELDVHVAGGVACIDCHVTKDHKISGASTMMATSEGRVSCTQCHEDQHKADKNLYKHTQKIACQTCHIPAFARGQATKMRWSWASAGDKVREEKGEHDQYHKETYMAIKGDFVWGKDVIPTYAWYNGTTQRYLKGDKIADVNASLVISKPAGSKTDKAAKIAPFKVHTGTQPYDKKNMYLLAPNTVKGFWSHLDWKKGLTDGADAAGLPFSGEFGFVETQEWIAQSHMVAPADKALKCADCHGGNRLDWKALGYSGDPMKKGKKK